MAVDSPGSWVTPGGRLPWEIDSAQYHTPGRLTRQGMQPRWSCIILRGVMFWRIFHWLAGYDNPASHAFSRPFRIYLIVLFTVFVESDEIETSSFFKNKKHTLNLFFIKKYYHFYFYTFWDFKGLKVSKN